MATPPGFSEAWPHPVFGYVALAIAAIMSFLFIREHVLRRRSRTRFRTRYRSLLALHRNGRKAQAAAEAGSRAKSEFLVSISHEIRTPLNAIVSAADAVSRMPLDRVQRTQVTRIMNESTRLGRTLNDVLDLRRIEEGHLVLQRVPLSPTETARDVVELFAARAKEKGLALELESDLPAGLLIAGDPRRLRQAIANLVDNGIKFTQRGRVTVTVSHTAALSANAVALLAIRVADTGIGMTTEQRTSLLAGNFGSLTSAGLAGHGLGLAIAQHLVRRMGGEITVRSVAGEGSEFGFTLPVSVLNAPDAATESPHAIACDGRRRVLIVDDVAANRIMLQMFLEQQGFSADYASGGEEAVNLAARNRYDAILMDLQMPVIDGYTATQRIRIAERPGQRTVIVAVTASGDAATRQKCAAAGMDAHFTKPLQLQKFCTDLTDLIGRRQAREQSNTRPAAPVTS